MLYVNLEGFLDKLLKNTVDITEILNIEPFLQFIEFFPTAKKNEVCAKIIRIFIENYEGKTISDPVSVHTLI